MAREGYVNARSHAYQAAEQQVLLCEAALLAVDSLGFIPEIEAIHRADRTRNRDNAIIERDKAAIEFNAIKSQTERPPSTRKYFDVTMSVCFKAGIDLHILIKEYIQANNVSFAELTRRALSAYLEQKP